jgi:3-oxoacyl-[acyl-carrier protein] reductase
LSGLVQDRVAFITGGSSGIGRGTALVFAREGARVAIADIQVEQGHETVRLVREAGGEAIFVKCDVSVASEVRAAVDTVVETYGRLDFGFNNAGIESAMAKTADHAEEDWDRVIEVNLTGAFICTQAALRPMMKQREGRIVSISSVVGQMGNAGQSNYAASKAALIGFSKSLAREVASRHITVNVVAPGLIDTDMTRALPQEVQAEWQSKVPLASFGTPEDVATAVCFLASGEAAYITGQVLAVNGGMYT